LKASAKLTPTLVIEVEGETQKDLFHELASAHEVFGEKQCGLCSSTNVRPVWRTVSKTTGKKVESFDYAEVRCDDCGAKLAFGMMMEGGRLFPKRKLNKDGQPDNEGEYGRHKGWHKWKPEATDA